jgi:hypothetical protein
MKILFSKDVDKNWVHENVLSLMYGAYFIIQ